MKSSKVSFFLFTLKMISSLISLHKFAAMMNIAIELMQLFHPYVGM